MNIITISREFGSGGRELGKRLADLLGYDYYDSEIISAVAQKSGMDAGYVANTLDNHGWKNQVITFRGTLTSAAYVQSSTISLSTRQTGRSGSWYRRSRVLRRAGLGGSNETTDSIIRSFFLWETDSLHASIHRHDDFYVDLRRGRWFLCVELRGKNAVCSGQSNYAVSYDPVHGGLNVRHRRFGNRR